MNSSESPVNFDNMKLQIEDFDMESIQKQEFLEISSPTHQCPIAQQEDSTAGSIME